jgi:AAA family ATP:ADP antiporter
MAEKRKSRILKRFGDIREGEAGGAGLLFLYFFFITSSAYIIKTVKISVFLTLQNPEKLPFAYLLTAFFIGFAVYCNTKLLDRLNRSLYVSLSLLFFALNILGFWFLFNQHWPAAPFIFWFWADIFMATSVTQFWIMVNDFFSPRQAKRLVGILVSGGLLGGIFGSLFSFFLVRQTDTVNLLLFCPVFLVLCLLLVNCLRFFPGYSQPKEPRTAVRRSVSYINSFLEFRKNRHLVFLAGIMAAGIIVATLVDFQFNTLVENHFAAFDDAREQMTAFLGIFFTGLLIFSYCLHVLMTGKILRKFTFRISLMITPLVLLVLSAGVLFIPAAYLFYWTIALKGLDKGLAHSLNQSVRELLYIPVPSQIKYKAKVFIDMFVNKMAKGLGALVLIVMVPVLGLPLRSVSLAVAAVILIWILLNLRVTAEYIMAVKDHIKIKWQDADSLLSGKADVDMAKMIFDTMQSKDRSSVLYAMNLFDLVQKDRISPEIKELISFKANEMRATGMDSLFELDGEPLLPQLEYAMEEMALSKQIKEIMDLDIYQNVMNLRLEKIVQKRGTDSEVERMEAAKVIGMMHPSSQTVEHLKELLRDESVDVVKYAIESASKVRERELAPHIIFHLKNPALQGAASESLILFGVGIVGMLKDYLSDSEVDQEVRRNIPDILAQIGEQKGADVLADELTRKEQASRAEIVRALYKIRLKDGSIHFPSEVINREILNQVAKCYLLIIELSDVMSDPKKAPLVNDVQNSLSHSLRQVFELLSLIYTPSDVMNAYQNICEGSRKNIDYSIELLDNMIRKDLMEYILPLIDDILFEAKLRKIRKGLKSLEKLKGS